MQGYGSFSKSSTIVATLFYYLLSGKIQWQALHIWKNFFIVSYNFGKSAQSVRAF